MAWNDDLTGTALNIASSNHNPLRVMAGPGTGKSYSMKKRIHRLIEADDIDPKRILAITFTRTAAADMIKELASLGVDGCENVRANTLHAFCYSILMRNDVLNYLNRFPRPLLSYPEGGILKFEFAPLLADLELIGGFGNKREMCRRLRAFEAAWARLQSDIPGWPTNTIDNNFHRELISWLTYHQGMLIGEIIPETLKYLRNNPTSEELFSFDHIVVDEFQDLNKAEQVLIDILSQNCNYFIIGDEDQSIYSFRFAHPEGIVSFNQTHPNTHDEPLIECRRCPQKVVEIANHLILNNHSANTASRLKICPTNSAGNIQIIQWKDIDSEVSGITHYINHLITDKGFLPGDVLILCSRRLIGYKIFEGIKSLNIDVHSYYYDAVLEDLSGQKAFTLLSLLVNNEDRVSLRFWLGLDSTKWLSTQYAKVRDYSIANSISPKMVMDGLVNHTIVIPRTIQIQDKYNELLSELSLLNGFSTKQIFDRLFPETEQWAIPLRNALSENITDEMEKYDCIKLIRSYISQPESPEEGNFVKIMSLHKAKGLTSKIVIIPTVIQGLIPSIDQSLEIAERELQLKEQRRLFYVGITRPTEILVISSVREIENNLAFRVGALVGRRLSKNKRLCIASQFISELGASAPTSKLGSRWAVNNYQ